MNRLLLDIKAKALLKSKNNKYQLVGFIKALLDINTWIIIIYRLSNIFADLRLYPFAKVFWIINRILFNVDIDPRANLAGGLVLIHGMGIVIGHEVKSLGMMKIYQGATIGGNMAKREDIDGVNTGQPVIEPNVTIGINSSILGPIKIGQDSIIGTGAIVTKNVKRNTVIIEANKIIERNL